MKEKALAEKRKTIRDIADELAAIGSGAAALEGVEQELSSTVSEFEPLKKFWYTMTMYAMEVHFLGPS